MSLLYYIIKNPHNNLYLKIIQVYGYAQKYYVT